MDGEDTDPRPPEDHYRMELAIQVAARGACFKNTVGAIILQDGRIRSVGYNGTVEGFTNCYDGGCPRCKDAPSGTRLDECICVHAEENALVSAARFGISVDGAECFVTHEPCLSCTKLLMQAHVKRVVYLLTYGKPETDAVRDQMRRNAPERVVFQQIQVDDALQEEWEEKLATAKGILDAHFRSRVSLPPPSP